MSHTTRRLAGVAVAGVCAAAALAAPAAQAGSRAAGPTSPVIDLQILSFNDFHGNVEAPTGSSGRIVVDHFVDTADTDKDGNSTEILDKTVDAGGVEYLATHLAEARKGHANSITVAAGDLVGASPLLSAAFHDEPTVESMNALGLDASAVGNHEFDEGYKELQRLQAGGCLDDGDGAANQNSCPDGTFEGADFTYLAANVVETATGKTVLPPYTIENRNGARIAFIGMTLENTPNIVTAAGVRGLQFKDEVDTANALVPVLKEQGVNAIVVLVHEGGFPQSKQAWTDPATGRIYSVNANYDFTCEKGGKLSGPIVDIAGGLDPAIDMVISGHTHAPYICNVPDPSGADRLVTSASSFGRLFTETDVKYDRRTQDIVRSSVAGSNLIVTRSVAADQFQTSLIAKYKELVRPIASEVIGSIGSDVLKDGTGLSTAGESQLGDLIADAQLADPSVVVDGQKPVIAFMNPGGIRTNLTYDSSKYGEPAGDVTYEEAFSVQPFNNYLVSMTLTGAQIKTLLAQQWSGLNATSPKILQVSKGLKYSYSATGVLGELTLGGAPLVDGDSYRIVTNNFLADGGDGFPAFKLGSGVYFGGLDIDAFARYLKANPGYIPGALDRITKTP
jgi:5'-nucleotidase